MTPMAFAYPVDELKGVIARILTAIENGGGEVNLRDLRSRLIDLTVLIERDPGISAAAEDLFAVAAVMVKDRTGISQGEARMRRLMRDARQRFEARMAAARPVAEAKGSCQELRLAA